MFALFIIYVVEYLLGETRMNAIFNGYLHYCAL